MLLAVERVGKPYDLSKPSGERSALTMVIVRDTMAPSDELDDKITKSANRQKLNISKTETVDTRVAVVSPSSW